MSLYPAMQALAAFCFPRVSGDEPRGLQVTGCVLEFSPRERG